MTNQTFPVSIEAMVTREQGITIYYPQIYGLANTHAQSLMNRMIIQQARELIRQQYEQQDVASFTEMIGTFELKTNERNILSLSLSNYAFAEGHAHGLTLMTSLTFNVETGEAYNLSELFEQGSDYVTLLSKHIKQQIQTRDIPVINEFTQISSDQEFYIADKVLVIYFQAYDITPGYVGLPMFPISVYDLQDIVMEDGPLERMMAQ